MFRYLQKASQSSLIAARQSAIGVSVRPAVATAGYHDNVIDHYENPRNVGKFPPWAAYARLRVIHSARVSPGSLDKKSKNVGTGLVGAPACGDVMKLQIMVDDDGKVVDAKFKTFGCGSAIASSSVATEWVRGKSLEECLNLKNTDIASHLKLPPVKLHCRYSMLAEDAIKAAVKDVQKKRATGNE
ncbi:Iscu [Symbiodinium sp. KB8]|nr:Iscu [Symbiodinium sp. KB8]